MMMPLTTPREGTTMPPRLTVPSIHALMDDPIFRAYMKRVPPATHANNGGEPWQIWVRTVSSKWLTRTYPTYRDVWPVFIAKFRDTVDTADVTITSRRVFYAPPGEWYKVKVRKPRRPTPDDKSTTRIVVEDRWRRLFHWDTGLEWCGRCRRPVYWQPLFTTHHALRRMPAVTEDDNLRCIICGIRWVAMPRISEMVRMP